MKRSLHLLFLLFLAACASTREGGGNKVQGICRSCKPHMIKGVWYTPQLFYDYDETGIGSWYGPGFHGKQKACGEIFDQNDISAAHKTLPLPTVVRATNLSNGKSVILIVDDRGPYVGDRIIDLSVGAAKEIGYYGKGLAKVRVQSLVGHSDALSRYLAKHGNRWGVDNKGRTWRQVYLEEIAGHYPEDETEGGRKRAPTPVAGSSKPHHEVVPIHVPGPISASEGSVSALIDQSAGKFEPVKAPQAASLKHPTKAKPLQSGGRYFIHLASFVNKENALKHAQEVKSVTSNVSLVETKVPPGQTFHVVRCGPYGSEDAAKMAITSLDVLGHNPQLVKE